MHHSLALAVLLIFLAGMASPGWADDEAVDEAAGPYLVWEFSRQNDPESGTTYYYQQAIIFMDAKGKPAWRTPLPDRMKQYQAGLDDNDMEAVKAYPRQAAGHFSFLVGALYQEKYVVIGDSSGMLVLDRRDGTAVLDYSDERFTRGDFLFFDKGMYTITNSDGQMWSGATRKAAFLALCGERLFFFNGRIMALFTMNPWKMVTAIQYDESLYKLPSAPAHCSVRFTIDGIDVLLEGIVYLH